MIFRKTVIFVLLLIFVCSIGFSQEAEESGSLNSDETALSFPDESLDAVLDETKTSFVNWISTEPRWSLSLNARANNYHNFMLYTISAGATIKMDMNEVVGRTGFDFSSSQINCTMECVYAPTFFEKLNAGIILINHFNWYYGCYYEFDFLTGLYVSYRPLDLMEIYGTGLFQLKCTRIYELADTDCSEFRSHCPAFSMGVNIYPLDWLSASFSLSSYEIYRYFLFFSPILNGSVSYKANKNLILTFGGECQFVDFFTLSANFSGLSIYISAEWRF